MSLSFSTATSGDYLADRRFDYADAAFKDGEFHAASELFEQVIERAPLWPPAHMALARACLGLHDRAGAVAALERVCALDPHDRLGAGVLLAALEGVARAQTMPDAYIAALFDEYAPRFGAHLVDALVYRAPAQLSAMLMRHAEPIQGEILDLGCGTGLMAQAMADACPGALCPGALWHGVDLSSAMLGKARETGLYASLDCAELLAWLRPRPDASANAVLACDVFCYVADITPVFFEVARVLGSGGVFAFTVQTHTGEGALIGADQRVHQSVRLVQALGTAAGLELIEEDLSSSRKDRGLDVPGALYLFKK